MALTRERMWEAVMASDAAFDGRFITGVHSTGIYCVPSCHARKPKPENVRFYESIAEARDAGLRACKKCRPDEVLAGINPELDRLRALIATVGDQPSKFRSVEAMASAAALSPSALFSATRTYFHVPPGLILVRARIQKAKLLLQADSMSVSEVGLAVGFESNSAFYENFGRRVGMAPAQYRRLGSAPEFRIDLPCDYRIESFLSALGRDPLSVTERVDGQRFGVALNVEGNSIWVRGEIDGSRVRVEIERPEFAFGTHEQICRLMGFDQDPRPFEEHVRSLGLGRLIEGREGTRIPMTATWFDGLVWCIVGQQVNLAFAFALRRRLGVLVGTPLGDGMFAPPTADNVANLTVEDLLPLQYSRRKAEYLIHAARSVEDGSLPLEAMSQMPPAVVEKILLGVRGIGPWSANYLMMRAFGLPDCLPLGDTGLTSALAGFFEVTRPGSEQTTALTESFRPYRSLATYHLWKSLSAVPS